MTVLRRNDARGFEAGPIRKFLVGAALAAVGLGAAFGWSQLIDQDATSVETGLTAVERNARAQSQTERAQSVERVDQALIDRYQPAAEFTLQDELAAIRAPFESTTPAGIEQARGQAMVDHYTNQWQAGAGTSATGPR